MAADPRPQDVDRPRRTRKGASSPETRSLLHGYQRAMRTELRILLRDLKPAMRPRKPRPSLAERKAMWALAVRLANQLGSEVDHTPERNVVSVAPRGAPRPIEF